MVVESHTNKVIPPLFL